METSVASGDDEEDYGEMPVLIPQGLYSNAESGVILPGKISDPRPQLKLKVTAIPKNNNVPNKATNKRADSDVNFPFSPPNRNRNRSTSSMNLHETAEEHENRKELQLTCGKCPAKFRDVANLKEHSKGHGRSTQSRFLCHYCDYSASQERSIIRHELLHPMKSEKDDESASSATKNLAKRVSEPFNMRISDMKRKKSLESAKTSSSPINSGNSNGLGRPRATSSDSSRNRNSEETLAKANATVPDLPEEVQAQTSIQGGQSSSRFDDVLPELNNRILQRDSSVPKKCTIKSLKVTNFMCFKEKRIDVDASNIILLEGEQKSARIIAFLIGLGYDLMQTRLDLPKVACGMALTSQTIVARGSLTCTVEIVLTLDSVPALEQKYGTHLLLKRYISSRMPLERSAFEIRSANEDNQFSTVPKFENVSSVLNILDILDIMPYVNLMLLDEETLQEVHKENGMWYSYYWNAVRLKKRDLLQRISIIQVKIDRVEEEMRCKEMKLTFLKTQLAQEYPASEPNFERLRITDAWKVRKLEVELSSLSGCLNELRSLSSFLVLEACGLEGAYSKRMSDTFQKFLEAQAFTGNVIIDKAEERLSIWVGSLRETEVFPRDVQEADSMWQNTSFGRQRVGAMGLFLAFWSIIENCPFFAVDSFSNNEVDFHVPSKGLPVVMDLIKTKTKSTKQQFCLSVPGGV